MRNTKLVALALATVVVAAFVVPGVATAGKKGGPKAVGTDPVGDFVGYNDDPAFSPLGDVLGADLVKTSIHKAGDELHFIIEVNSLETVPEIVRYIWGISVDGEYVEFDGKYTNYTRGACDPTSGQCPPPRDPGQQPFMVRANCGDAGTGNFTVCEEVGIVQGIFDTTANTITIPVPMDMINAKPKSKITAGLSAFSGQAGGNVLAIMSAFASQSNWPRDAMNTTKTYVVPK